MVSLPSRIARACLGATILLAGVGVAPAAAGEPPAARSWVVQFRSEAPPADRAAAIGVAGATLVETLAGGEFALVEATERPSNPAIAAAHPTVPMAAAATPPNDPLYGVQWHLPAMQAADAWDVTTGAGAVVAIIDTGVAYEDHGGYRRAPDLAQTHFAPGWDFVNADSHPNDDHGHGTHVAGTVAQSTGNGLGAAGVAPGATVMPVKVLDSTGSGTDWNIAQGLRWAADHGADVANLSISGPTASVVLADAVAYAVSRGVTVVAAAGNEGGAVAYPAAYPDVISVGSVRFDRTRVPYSNYGVGLDLVAPGGDLGVDQNGDGTRDGVLQQTFKDKNPSNFCWCLYQGTSMAAPHVSGAAALLVAQGAATTPGEVQSALLESALDLGTSGWDLQTGRGLLQARAAVDYAAAAFGGGTTAPAPAPGSEPAPTPTTEPSPDGTETEVVARDIDDSCPSGSVNGATFLDVPVSSPHLFAIECVAWWGVASGRDDRSYLPASAVGRGQMASFLSRLIAASGVALPSAPGDSFGDDDDSAHELAINQLAALGVVNGTAAGSFSPSQPVTRAQMATFLTRAAEVVAGSFGSATRDYFGDDSGSPHEAAINLTAAYGLAAGTATGSYSPGAAVRRDQMASFLARTLDLLVEDGHTDPPTA